MWNKMDAAAKIMDNKNGRRDVKRKGILFIIAGPSGSGKTSLAERVLKEKELRTKIKKSISCTTRPMRSGERNRKDYYFISEERFLDDLNSKKFLEWTKYLGYYYGTPKDLVKKYINEGKNILLCLDLLGVNSVSREYPRNSVSIFIMPPSMTELRRRIENRCSRVGKKEIRQRINLAKAEIIAADKFDYRLVNDNFQRTVYRLKKVLLDEITAGSDQVN